MKHLLIVSLALGLLVPLSSATADQWERQKEQQQMMRDSQPRMHSDDAMMRRQSNVGLGRETKLDPDRPRTVEDLENMPATAAGREEKKGMMDPNRQEKRRSGHRGEVRGDY